MKKLTSVILAVTAVAIVCISGNVVSKAQITITIPKIPKIKKTTTQTSDTTTTTQPESTRIDT
jgi:hypothetical protein